MHAQSIDRQQWALQQPQDEIAESERLADMPTANFRSFGPEGDAIWTTERIEAFRSYFRNYADCLRSHRQEAHRLPVSSACAQGKPPGQLALEQRQQRQQEAAEHFMSQWVWIIALLLSMAASLGLSILMAGPHSAEKVIGALTVFPGLWVLITTVMVWYDYTMPPSPGTPAFLEFSLAHLIGGVGGLYVLLWCVLVNIGKRS